MTGDHFGGHYANAGARDQKMTMVDKAAKVLYDAERHEGDIPWKDARLDQRQPYQHMARRMLTAAGVPLDFKCTCGAWASPATSPE